MSRNKLFSLFATLAFLFVISSRAAFADQSYPVTVDYDMTVEQMIAAGNYDYINANINSQNFPTQRRGRMKVQLELIPLNGEVSTDEALAELDRGYRPATLPELLAFGAKFPEVQRKFSVVALGSVCLVDGLRGVAYLYRYGSGRSLRLYWFEGSWGGSDRFLAVRKSQ